MNHYYTHFDKLWEELNFSFNELQPTQVKESCRLPKYPVNNCWMSEDTNILNFEFAMAGYGDKDIQVIGGKNSFTVRATPQEDTLNSDERCIVLHHGISDKKIDFSIKIDEQYDTKKAKVLFANGLLRVSIPKAKEAESTVLFG